VKFVRLVGNLYVELVPQRAIINEPVFVVRRNVTFPQIRHQDQKKEKNIGVVGTCYNHVLSCRWRIWRSRIGSDRMISIERISLLASHRDRKASLIGPSRLIPARLY